MGKPLEFPGGLAWAPQALAGRARFTDLAGEEPAAAPEPGSLDELLAMGVGGDRLAAPDVPGQLRRAEPGVRALVCNLVDHEPGVALNTLLGLQYARELARGMEFCARRCGAGRVMVAVNASAAGSLPELLRLCSGMRAVWAWLPERYPRGHASLVVYSVLRKRLKPGTCPTTIGAAVLDGAALWQIGRALAGRRIDRVPVALRHAGETRYALAPAEWTAGKLAEALGVATPAGMELYRGDLAARVPAQEEAIGHGENRFHLAQPLHISPAACTRCGWCVQYCPTGVQPAVLLEAAQQQDGLLAEQGGLRSCIECGVCEHVCPSRLPLTAAIRTLKQDGNRRER